MTYAYIGSPYSGTELEQEERYDAVMEYVAWLVDNTEHTPFSPILHNHPLAHFWDIAKDAVFWKKYNKKMLKPAYAFHLLNIPGAKNSTGLEYEARYATTCLIPIFVATPTAEGNYEIVETPIQKLVEVLR